MLSFIEKISYLESTLHVVSGNYVDSFKTEIAFYFEDFEEENVKLMFVNKFSTHQEIDNWVEKLVSRIILKFDSDNEQLNDFIFDYIEFG